MQKKLEHIVAVLKKSKDPQTKIATFIERFGGTQIYHYDNHRGAEIRWHGQNGFLHYFIGILENGGLKEPPYPIAKGFDSERNSVFIVFQKSIWPIGTVFHHAGRIYIVVYNETTFVGLNGQSRQQTLFCAIRKEAIEAMEN